MNTYVLCTLPKQPSQFDECETIPFLSYSLELAFRFERAWLFVCLLQENEKQQQQQQPGGINEHQKTKNDVWCTFKEFICSKILVLRALILFFIWATNAFVFYGLSLNSTSLSGNKYMNFILVCLGKLNHAI